MVKDVVSINEALKQKASSIPIRRVYAIVTAIAFFLLCVGIAFIGYSSDLNKKNTGNRIQHSTKATQEELKACVDVELRALQAAAVLPAGRELLAEDEAFNQLVESLVVYNDYIQVGITDTEGNALIMDKSGVSRMNVESNPYYQKALIGEKVITPPIVEERFLSEVNYYAVPIFDQISGEMLGTLFAADDQQHYYDIIERTVYSSSGTVYLIDSHGDFILKPAGSSSIFTEDNFFACVPSFKDDHKMSLKQAIEEQVSGQMRIAFDDGECLVSYEPLGINDWIVLYSVPTEDISPELRITTAGTIIITCVSAFVFIFFISLIRYSNHQNRKVLERMALEDPVTGRDNYQKFLIEAEKILATVDTSEYGICYCDVKDFKYINELFGRETSDELLRYLSDAFAKTLYHNEAFARVFADTFVILFKNGKTIRTGTSRFESIAQLAEVFPETFYNGYKVELYGGMYLLGQDFAETCCDSTENNASASFTEKVDEDIHIGLVNMIDRANTALKAVRNANNGEHLGFYSQEMHRKTLWENEIASKMEPALENDEFIFYLQPKIDIQNGDRVIGAEALVRWQSPVHGLLPPSEFIDLAERNGFILKLDHYLFDKACDFYKRTVLDPGNPRYILSVNVSRRLLEHGDFVARYAEIKNKYGIPNGCIELEFTESLIFENLDVFKDVTAMCRGVGFLCSLDDFGAGYSALNVLKSLNVDALKLDRMFFASGGDCNRGRILVHNIINLAKSLDMKVVAEGVDQEWQVEELRGMDCDMVQGYVFSKPLPPEDFIQFVEERS